MSNAKKRATILTGVLFVLAVALLLFGTIGGTRAALTESATLTAQMETTNTGVTVDLSGVTDGDTPLRPGVAYDESLVATNTSSIDTYLRLDLYKYWTFEGKKDLALDPALIKLTYNTTDWVVQEGANNETVIAYYKSTLAPGQQTKPLVTKLTVDGKLATMVYVDKDTNELVFAYEGAEIRIDVQASVVQTHNAQQAMLSAWGISQFPA